VNKRAEITITLLVIGVFVVCTLALISFISFKIVLRDSFVGVDLIEKVNSEIEENSLNNHYEEEIDKGFWFWQRPRVVFSVEYRRP